jgi:hypothetical protein
MRKYLFVYLVLFLSCSNSRTENQSKVRKDKTVIVNDTISRYIADWKKDSLGCLGLRDYNKLQYILKYFNLISKSKEEVVNILGQPDFIINDDTEMRFTYYFDTMCDKGEMIDSTDFCWARVTFDKGSKVKQIDNACL